MKGRILTRREALLLTGAAGVVFLIGCGGGGGQGGSSATNTTNGSTGSTTSTTGTTGTTGVDLVATPEVTEGPFFEDERLNRSNLLSGTSRSSVINGYPLTLRFTVYELNGSVGTPLQGAWVDVWHADALGVYSDEPAGTNEENTQGETWLRGYQVTDADGLVEFQTIWPGFYRGRTIHIHLKVRMFNSSGSELYEFTTQMFMDETSNGQVMALSPYNTNGTRDTYNTGDGIYSAKQADGSAVGSHLMLNLTDNPSGGKIGTFSIAFDMG